MSKVPESWRGRKLVACEGGPRTRAWFFADDWAEQVRLAISGGETPYVGRTLGYVETDGLVDHPTYPQLSGKVLRWNPDLAAQRSLALPTDTTEETSA